MTESSPLEPSQLKRRDVQIGVVDAQAWTHSHQPMLSRRPR